jgi:hypothetical protein
MQLTHTLFSVHDSELTLFLILSKRSVILTVFKLVRTNIKVWWYLDRESSSFRTYHVLAQQ